MNVQLIKTWFTTEWVRLLSMAHYNREYMYLPEPTGKNSQFAHDIVSKVFEIIANLPYKQSNVVIMRYVFNLKFQEINNINGLSNRRNQQLLNIALLTFGDEFKPVYDFSA